MRNIALSLSLLVFSAGTLSAEDWRQFRGNLSNGVSSESNGPAKVEEENIAWKIELEGRGLSGPIIIGDRVYLTSSSGVDGDRLHVYCFSTQDGSQLWERQFWATGNTSCHDKMCTATPTPASDGEHIFAFFSSNDLACLDLDGKLLWYRGIAWDFPNASNSLGMASSPVVVGKTVIVQVESDAESFAMGIDVETGLTRWQIERPRRASWTSPLVFSGKEGQPDLVLLQSSAGLAAVDPMTGEVKWAFDKGASTIPTATVDGNTIYVPSNGITAIEPTADGFEVLWNEGKLSPSTPSPLAMNGKIYTVNRAGVLVCADAKEGKVLWQLRLQGPYSGTPIAAGDYLYFFNEKGQMQIVQPGEKSGEIVDTHELGETILCTPAFAGGAVYVRSDDHLWKITP